MAGKRIKGRTVALFEQLQILLACLEIDFNIPPGSITTDDFFF